MANPPTREEWRVVSETGGRYVVSTLGRVQNIETGRFLRPYACGNKRQYRAVDLRRWGERGQKCFIHHLVLEAFVGPRPVGCETRHLNGAPDDNRLRNLAWGTVKENADDRRSHGQDPCKLTPTQVRDIRRAISKGESQSSIAKRYPVHPSTIAKISTGARWSWLD